MLAQQNTNADTLQCISTHYLCSRPKILQHTYGTSNSSQLCSRAPAFLSMFTLGALAYTLAHQSTAGTPKSHNIPYTHVYHFYTTHTYHTHLIVVVCPLLALGYLQCALSISNTFSFSFWFIFLHTNTKMVQEDLAISPVGLY